MRRAVLACVALALGACLTRPARAEPLRERRSDAYYQLHGGLALGGLLATGAAAILTTHHGPGFDLVSFRPDDVVRENFSSAAANLSDKLLAVSMTMPLMLQMSNGFDTSMGNASLIYVQAQSANLLLATSVKAIVRRPRPYTHSSDPRVIDFMDRQGSDAYASFFSGHSSTAFTAATAGSILYAARTDELAARHTVWGFSFLLAGMTAQLRVRAGRHYRTDIWIGAMAGLGTGALIPALHHVELGRVRGSELAAAGGAFAVTMLLSEVVDFCSVLDTLRLCALPRDVSVPLRDARLVPSWRVVPAALPGGAALTVAGEL